MYSHIYPKPGVFYGRVVAGLLWEPGRREEGRGELEHWEVPAKPLPLLTTGHNCSQLPSATLSLSSSTAAPICSLPTSTKARQVDESMVGEEIWEE